MRQTTHKPSPDTPVPGDRLHRGHRSLLLAPISVFQETGCISLLRLTPTMFYIFQLILEIASFFFCLSYQCTCYVARWNSDNLAMWPESCLQEMYLKAPKCGQLSPLERFHCIYHMHGDLPLLLLITFKYGVCTGKARAVCLQTSMQRQAEGWTQPVCSQNTWSSMYLIVSHLEKITGYMTSHFLHYANNFFQELPHVRLMRKTVWLIREINCVFIYAASDKYCVENVWLWFSLLGL